MKKFLLTAALLGLSLASAQSPDVPAANASNPYLGGNITREYRASDLKNSYGILDVAVGEIWVLNLPDDVTDVVTSREGVLQFNQRGPRVVVGALASSGSYPMLVMTADSVYFFQVRLSASRGGGVRNVVVRGDEAPSQDQAIPGFPSTAAQPVGAVSPSTTVAQTMRAAALVPATAQAPKASSPATAAVQATAPAPAVTVPVQGVSAPQQAPQAQVKVEWRALTNGTQTMLYYRATNTSSGDVLLDERTLSLKGPDGALTHTAPLGLVQLGPSKTAYGQVALDVAPTSLNVLWSPTNTWGERGPVVSAVVAVEALKAN